MTNTSHFLSAPPNSIAAGWYPDPITGVSRWWNGIGWTDNYQGSSGQPVPTASSISPMSSVSAMPTASLMAPMMPEHARKNGLAVAALTLGISGWVLMAIPWFIGWLVGGPLDIAAVVLGVVGIVRANEIGGVGRGMAVAGIIFASVSLLSVFVGAGTIW